MWLASDQRPRGRRRRHTQVPAMTVNYVVTVEFEMRAPVTHRGTVAASQPEACCRMAVREARKALRPMRWSSLVCVLLERLSDATGAAKADEGRARVGSTRANGTPVGLTRPAAATWDATREEVTEDECPPNG